MTKRFRQWLAGWLRGNRRSGPRYRAKKVAKAPSQPLPALVYLVGDDECDWAAVLRCPCECGAVIQLSLVRDSTPSWQVEIHRDGLVTLSPSVHRTVDCRSHFIIYRGRLIWCGKEVANLEES
jgi:hypothetical protein